MNYDHACYILLVYFFPGVANASPELATNDLAP